MPRTNNAAEIIKYLDTVYIFDVKSGGASTTTAEAITQDMADTDVTALTGITANDWFLISGDGGDELVQVSSTVTGPPANVVWVNPLYWAQSSGATLTEMQRTSINHIAEGGLNFGIQQSSTDIKASTSRVALASFLSAAVFPFTIPMLGLVGPNLQLAAGAPEVEIGAGSQADPYKSGVNGTNVGTRSTVCFRCEGTYTDGDTYFLDILGVTIEANFTANIGAPNPGGITLQGKASGYILGRY